MFIEPHAANIQNTDQGSSNESQPTTRNKEHVFRIVALKSTQPSEKDTRFDKKFEPKQLEQMETDIVSNGIFNQS